MTIQRRFLLGICGSVLVSGCLDDIEDADEEHDESGDFVVDRDDLNDENTENFGNSSLPDEEEIGNWSDDHDTDRDEWEEVLNNSDERISDKIENSSFERFK